VVKSVGQAQREKKHRRSVTDTPSSLFWRVGIFSKDWQNDNFHSV